MKPNPLLPEVVRALARPLLLSLGLVLCGAPAQAQGVKLAERPWVLQAWGKPDPAADAGPNAACDAGSGAAPGSAFLFAKSRSSATANAELIIPSVLVPGKAYELSLPMRLVRGGAGVDVLFRRDSPYYETTAIRTVQAQAGWQTVVLRGVHDAPRVGSVRVGLRQDGSAICLGKPVLREISPDLVGADDRWHPVSDRFFGIHLNKLGRHNNWPTFQPDLVRMWGTGTTWHEMQPKAGAIQWRDNPHAQRLEYYLHHVRKNSRDAAVLMTIGMTPQWASQAGDNGACATSSFGERSCMPPAQMESWRKHVRELATRFDGGRIAVWEVWNEADVPTHWLGSPELMVEMVRVAREETRKADARSTLIGPNVTTNGMRFLNDFLVAGGGKHIDGISMHAYLGFGSNAAVSRLRNLREMLRSHGLNLPIWNTESNTACGGDADPSAHSLCDRRLEETVLQAAILHAAEGFENFTFYTWEGAETEVGGVGMVKGDFRSRTRLGELYVDLVQQLRGSMMKMAPRGPDPITRVLLTRNGRQCVLGWSTAGPVRVSPSAFQGADLVRDLQGRPAERDASGAWMVGPMPLIGCESAAPRN